MKGINKMNEKVVLAYSGGLDTSISINWIKEKYNMDVIAALIDCGQPDDLKEAYQRALDTGASKSVIIDAKEEFINDFIFPSIKANLKYEKNYPLATALARPLIVKKLVEVAKKEGAREVLESWQVQELERRLNEKDEEIRKAKAEGFREALGSPEVSLGVKKYADHIGWCSKILPNYEEGNCDCGFTKFHEAFDALIERMKCSD